MPRLPALALATLMLAVATPSSHAQRNTRENLNGWVTWVSEVDLHPRWGLDHDVSVRQSGPVDEMQQILVRPSIRFNALPNLRLAWGYAYASTWPYGKLPVAYRFPEHRMWQHVQLNHPVGRVQLAHRYRLEQRWLGRVTAASGDPAVSAWVRTNRMRYQVRGTVPLQGATLDADEWYVAAGDEVFLNWGANIQANQFDQNRMYGYLGRRLGRSVRVEAGYIEQLILRGNGRDVERNHTLAVALHTRLAR